MFLCRRVRMMDTSRFKSSMGFLRRRPRWSVLPPLWFSSSTFFTIYSRGGRSENADTTRQQP